ncbi:MAG: maleylpyruvate isomerase family mycothiol-dependent enzyme [Acidimicrobiales bacterium]
MTVGKEPLVELLRSQYKSLDYLGSSLAPREWHSSATLPGWAVFDVYAHIIGTESLLEGYELPYVKVDVSLYDHVRNETGVFNETWVESLSHLGPASMLDRFRRITAARLRSLDAMTTKEFEAETATPVGPAPYWRFMQLRVFDCWMHEQDIREGLDRPGHESGPCAKAAVDEAERAMGYVVGKKTGAPDGTAVRIELTGPVKRTIDIEVSRGRARTVDDLDRSPTATISMSSSLFMRLVGGRAASLSSRLGEIDFDGDLDLAGAVVTNLAFTN